MNIIRKNKPVHNLHKKLSWREQVEEFWLSNQGLLILLLLIVCISILLLMIGYAFASGHIHFLSSEANNYEHLEQIVLCYGGGFL